MRTETIQKHYKTFSELSPDDQEKAIERNYSINVDFEWWDCEYESLGEIMREAGLGEVMIRGFDLERGSYVVLEGIATTFSQLSTDGAKMETNCPPFFAEVIRPFLNSFTAKEKRYLAMLEKRDCLGRLGGKRDSSGYGYPRHDCTVKFYGNACTGSIERIEKLVNKLESEFADLLANLESFCLSSLRAQYEYLTGEEAIRGTLEANEIEFEVNEQGEMI